jgi:predicted RNase H-like nuclease (RuvC/YqgF family)
MRWTIIAVILGIFLSPVSKAQTVIYSWRDEAGKIHIVDNMSKVPAEHRGDLRIHRFSSMRNEEKPQPQVPSKPVVRAKGEDEIERREQFAEEMEEIRTSITLLSDRLDELTRERERGRLGIIRQRARGGSVVREQGKMEEIEGEIELLTTQLEKKRETLRSLENKSLKGGE